MSSRQNRCAVSEDVFPTNLGGPQTKGLWFAILHDGIRIIGLDSSPTIGSSYQDEPQQSPRGVALDIFLGALS